MSNKLNCALNWFPEGLVKTVIMEQAKVSIREIINGNEMRKIMKDQITSAILPKIKDIVGKYCKTEGDTLLMKAVKNQIDDNGFPDKVYDEIEDCVERILLKKLKSI